MRAPKYFSIFAIVAVVLSLFNLEASAQPATLRLDAWMTDGQVFDIVHSDGITYIGGQFNNVLMFTGNGTALNARTATPFPLPRVNGTIFAVIPDGAGGWYIGGNFITVDDFSRPRLAHILSNGTLDGTWRPEVSGGANPRVFALAMRGKIVYVGGEFTQMSGQTRSNIAAVDATTGQVITSWDPNALTGTPPVPTGAAVRALAVDGRRIYVGGAFTNIGGRGRNRIAVLDSATGTAIESWNPDAGPGTGTVRALAVAGSIVYAGGNFTTIGGANRNRLAALDAVTGKATDWNPKVEGVPAGASLTAPEINAIDVAGAVVYVGGLFTTIGGRTRNNVAAVDAATGDATEWNPNATVPAGTSVLGGGQVLALAVNGSAIYVGGRFTSIGNEPRRFLAALDADKGAALPLWNPNLSTVIPSFTPAFVATFASQSDTAHVYAIAMSGLTVYAGGSLKTSGWTPRSSIAAFNTATGRPTAWNPNATGDPVTPGTVVRALAVSGDRVYAGGNFTSIGGAQRNRLAALNVVTGNAIRSWNPSVEGAPFGQQPEINAVDVAGDIVHVGGTFTRIAGEPRVNIAALQADTSIVIPWTNHPIPSSTVRSLVVRGSVVYFGGDFTTITTSSTPPTPQTRNLLAALNAGTGLLTSWNPDATAPGIDSPSVQALTVSGSIVYAGGRFTTIGGTGGQSRNHIVALDAVSGIPTTWNPNIDGTTTAATNIPVRAIAVSGSIVYFGGEFTRVGTETRNNVAAVSADNGMPTEWNPNAIFVFTIPPFSLPTPLVNALEAVESTVFVGGNFNNIAEMTHSFFAPLGETPLNPVPTLRSMNPKFGKRLQTLDVTFEGSNFIDDVSSVNVGSGIAVNSITVRSATRLTANITISATASTGPRNFSVTNPPPGGGTSTPIPFKINNPAPTVANVVPASGVQAQILNVTVNGSNFISGATTVSFGPDIAVNSVTVISSTRLTANITISAEAEIGDRDVAVTNAFPGGGSVTRSHAFTVDFPIPTLSSISPTSGTRFQTLPVVFTGAGFIEGVTKVNVGSGITINSVTVMSATSLEANLTITDKVAAGPRAFSLTNARPGGGVSESRVFTVNNPAPTLTSIDPTSAGRGQTHDIILKGTNFIDDVSSVSFGPDITVNLAEVESDTQIIANITIPLDAELDDREVIVSNTAPGGGADTTAFSVVNPRVALSSVTPSVGSLGQTLEVNISGMNFITEGINVDFDEGISVEITVVSSTQITAKITIDGSAPQGAHNVAVTNAEPGGGTTMLPKAFAVVSGPIVHFSVPTDLRGIPDDTVEVPLNIDPNGRKLGSFDAKLSFDPEVLRFIDFVRGPILSSDWQIDVNHNDGAITLGAFVADASLQQAETAIALLFRVRDSAKPGTTVPLVLSNLAATNINAGALPTEGASGLLTVPTEARVSGKLQYFSDRKPLPSDTVRMEIPDLETRLAISDADGFFEFDGTPFGSTVFLFPHRLAGNFPEGTITAGDALKAFKGRAGGPEPLNGYESLAADVTGDCQITSGDALAILKRATGKWESFRRFVKEDWRFVDASFNITPKNWCTAPPKRVFTTITQDQHRQNFIGIIRGDVNGNFGGTIEKSAGHGPSVAIAEPALVVGSEQFNFAVEISAGRAYDSFDLTLAFNNQSVRVVNVQLGSMLAPEDWQMDWNAPAPGVLRVAGFSMSAACIKGEGTLLLVQAMLAQPAAAGESFGLGMPSALFGVNGEETPAQSETVQLSAKLPQQYALAQNYPNPFSPETPSAQTAIQYSLPQAGVVHLQIYDMLGHLVRTLVSGPQEAGAHKMIWNGRKDDGSPAATGIYLYRLEAGTFTKTNKLVLQK